MIRVLPLLAPLALTGCIALPASAPACAVASDALIIPMGVAVFAVGCVVLALSFMGRR